MNTAEPSRKRKTKMRKKDNRKWKPWRGNPSGREFRGHNGNGNRKNAKA